MRLGIGIGTNRAPSGEAGGFDLPILRRDMLQEDEFFVLQEDASEQLVALINDFIANNSTANNSTGA